METPPPPQPPQDPQPPQAPAPQPAPQPVAQPQAAQAAYAPPPGPAIRFDYIGSAFSLVFADAATWIVAALFVIIPIIVVNIVSSVLFVGMLMTGAWFLAFLLRMIIGILVLIVFNLMIANMFRMAIKALQGEKPNVNDMFKFGADAGNILVASLLISLGTMIGFSLCLIPGLIFGGLTMFTLPLIVDKKMGAVEAISASIDMLKKDLVLAALFAIAAYFCSFIVLMLTMAVWPLAVSMLYRDYVGFNKTIADPQPAPS